MATQFETEVIDGLTSGEQIAVRLNQAGADLSSIGFLVSKLKSEGYAERIEDLHLGILRWKEQTPQCFPVQPLNHSNALMMEALRERMAQRA
jgi:hypothetical protein